MADLITLSRAKIDVPEAQGNTTYDSTLATLITAASQAIQRYCGQGFGSAAYDELYNGTGQPRLLLRSYPVISVESVRYRPVAVLKVQNTAAANQQARVSVTSSGLKLVRVASGVTTTITSVTFAGNVTLQAVADAVNALGNGWNAQVTGGYGSWPSADLYCPNGPVGGTDAGQGALDAAGRFADLRMYTAELAGFQVHNRGGWLLRVLPYQDPELDVVTLVWPEGPANFRVQYTAGYASVPEPVQAACSELVATLFRQAGRSVLVAAERTGAYGYQMDHLDGRLPPVVRMLLEGYRRHPVTLLGG